MQEHINEKKCFKCNCLNLENAVKCVNCGTQIGYIIYPKVIIIPLINKHGTESVNEEVKS